MEARIKALEKRSDFSANEAEQVMRLASLFLTHKHTLSLAISLALSRSLALSLSLSLMLSLAHSFAVSQERQREYRGTSAIKKRPTA